MDKNIDLTGASWYKSTITQADGDCVEVAFVDGGVGVRDSKNPDGPALTFTPREWRAFVGGVENGEFNLPS